MWCETDKETIPHMLWCTLRHTQTWKWEKDLQDNLLTTGIGPQTRALITHLIKFFVTNEEYNISVDYDDLTPAVCYDQAQIG